MVAEMSVASAAQEQGLQCVQQPENGATNGDEVAPKSSTIQTSSSSKAGIELIFGPNGEVLTQPSSPPHNYRHSRAYRHFKNPPQPHMCIRVSTANGEEVFINVLSWTRIVVPQEPTDPIPLYGGMKVPPGSPRCPPLVYAVMANPEVLKDSGRHSKDPEERRAMIELMCDFVEAMNPDLKLNRNAVILKDRDISGELKDVWNAVQAQRDREREEQMLQHQSHAPPPQQMYLPHKQEASHDNLQNSPDSVNALDNNVIYGEFGPETASTENNASRSPSHSTQSNSNDETTPPIAVTQSAISNNANTMKNSSVNDVQEKMNAVSGIFVDSNVEQDQTDSTNNSLQNGAKNQQLVNNSVNNTGHSGKQKNNTSTSNGAQPTAIPSAVSANPASGKSTSETISPATSPVSPTTASPSTPPSTTTTTSSSSSVNTTTTTTTTSTKKEKLGGFLPNSCIFPRFKNKNKDKNKEKDKDKDKEKDKSSNHSSKERTLLNSLKKTTTAATNAFTSKSQSHNEDSTSNSVKNCLNLEAEVEKLDLNKMDAPHANDVLIKVATPAAK